jgi:imidazolonepropionase-like amidohydrolase
LSPTAAAQQKPSPLSPYVKEDAPVLVLEHARLIDGTGSAPKEDMRIDIAGGKITAVQAASAHSPYPANAKVLDMTGKTVIPGLVGMHEHLFYPAPARQPEWSAQRIVGAPRKLSSDNAAKSG